MKNPELQDEAFIADVTSRKLFPDDQFRLWWVGQSGFLLRYRDSYVLFDPYLSDSLTKKYAGTDKPHVRMVQRVVAPELLGFVDIVTCSHGHTDHLDADTLVPLGTAARRAHSEVNFYYPEAIHDLVMSRTAGASFRGNPVNSGDSKEQSGITIWPIPAAHDKLDVDDKGRNLYLGYIVRFGNWSIYHSGDSVVYDGLIDHLRFHQVDVAILPINGKVGNMGGRDAARLAKDLGVRLVIPCHYDLFYFNTAEPSEEFIPECKRLKQPYRVLKPGEPFSSVDIPR